MTTTYRIVVGVDGSVGSLRALRWAVREAAARKGAVEAVTAFSFDGLNGSTIPYRQVQREAAEQTLVDAVAAAHEESPGVPVTTKVIFGYAPDVLVDAAGSADLLVLGSHGHGRLFHAVLGSVAEQCVRHAGCPVVVLPVPRPEPVTAGAAGAAKHGTQGETGFPAGIL